MTPGGAGKAGDLAAAKCGGALARAADLNDRHVLVRFESQALEQHSCRDVGGAANPADADAFPFELLFGFDRFLNDQLIGRCIDEASNRDQVAALAITPPVPLPNLICFVS